MKLSLAVSHSFYVFPRLRNRNLSHIPVRRERRIKGDGFLGSSDRKAPAGKCGIRNVGERGASAAEQKFDSGGSSGRTSVRGLAVRFGPASWASLVIEFCRQGGFYRLAEKFVSCCMFLLAGEGLSFAGEVPLSRCVFKRSICRGIFRLEQN